MHVVQTVVNVVALEQVGVVRLLTIAEGVAKVVSAEPTPWPPLDELKKTAMFTSCTRPGLFALSYDDGPYIYTPKLLDVLRKHDVKATFFINGDNFGVLTSPENQQIIRDMYKEGHLIGSHTHTHKNLTKLTVEEMWYEMDNLDQALKSIIGVRPRYMRPPHGAVNDLVLTALGSWGYIIPWINVDTGDWMHKDAQLSLENINKGLDKANPRKDSFISLIHDPVPSTPEFTDMAIQSIKARGYKFVTTAECRGDSNPTNWYRL